MAAALSGLSPAPCSFPRHTPVAVGWPPREESDPPAVQIPDCGLGKRWQRRSNPSPANPARAISIELGSGVTAGGSTRSQLMTAVRPAELSIKTDEPYGPVSG